MADLPAVVLVLALLVLVGEEPCRQIPPLRLQWMGWALAAAAAHLAVTAFSAWEMAREQPKILRLTLTLS